ncbi:MAG: hypothetical protein JXB49_21770 [Bacteroidales bacterium]|nr:hypothetical protein [Bacteroidales bacterium]
MSSEVLKIGMPAGSLANPNRGGNLISLLESAGFKTSGYESGGPSKFTTANFMFGWDGRPQEFSSQLGLSELDVAIAGDDWIKERMLELKHEYNTDIRLERVLGLNRGYVKIVGICDDNAFPNVDAFIKDVASREKLITVVSEMPYLALEWLREKLNNIGLLSKFEKFSVQKYKTPSRIESGILVYETWGKTEAKVKNKGAEIGVEITQTGSAIKNYGLRIIDTVMESQTSIWINPEIKKDENKLDLLKMFLINLYGSINAEDKVLIIFNVPNTMEGEVESFLSKNNLFADEPTKTQGKDFTVFNIQVDISNKDLPLAKIRYELAKRGAKNIDTLPISSSIPSLDALDL